MDESFKLPGQGQDQGGHCCRVDRSGYSITIMPFANVVAEKLSASWSPGQISRWLRRFHPPKISWHAYVETLYEAKYRALILGADAARTLR